MYNRTVYVHKLVYEGMHRFELNEIEDSNVNSFELSSTISDLQEKLNDFLEKTTQVSHDYFIESDFFGQFNIAVIDCKLYLENSSDLAKFWPTYLTMIDLLLSILYATGIGDWKILLECIRYTTGYNFACAYDSYNYAKYLTPWLAKCLT